VKEGGGEEGERERERSRTCYNFRVVCVYITAVPITKLFAGGGNNGVCVCLLLQDLVQSCLCVCLLLQDLVQSCLHGGGGDMGGHVLRETTSRGLCGLVCLSRTSERGGEGDCVKEGGGEEGKCERERALERLRYYNPGH
jgi:hypothetical protein